MSRMNSSTGLETEKKHNNSSFVQFHVYGTFSIVNDMTKSVETARLLETVHSMRPRGHRKQQGPVRRAAIHAAYLHGHWEVIGEVRREEEVRLLLGERDPACRNQHKILNSERIQTRTKAMQERRLARGSKRSFG